MADGDAVIRDLQAASYLGDTGITFKSKTPSYQLDQAGLGWVENTSATQYSAPRGLRKRRVLLWDPADHTKRAGLVVATPSAYNAIVCGTTTFLVAYRGRELTMTAYGKSGESWRGRIADTDVQVVPG